MTRYATLFAALLAVLALAATAHAQAASGTTTLSVTVAAEAALTVDTSSTALANSGTTFSTDYAGTTNLTYYIRTTKTGGTGSITSKITADFSPSGGPSVGTPPTTGDALTYTCTVSSPGTGCTGAQTSSTSSATPVATFGANATSTKSGNTSSVAWDLTDDPVYATGSYSATVTFTVSAT